MITCLLDPARISALCYISQWSVELEENWKDYVLLYERLFMHVGP